VVVAVRRRRGCQLRKRLNEFANFGFGTGPTKRKPMDSQNRPSINAAGNPFKMVKVEQVIKDLKKRAMGISHSVEEFFGELHMGEGVGAVQILFCPYGGLKTVIRRKAKDLRGEDVWVCKRVVVMDDKRYDGHDSVLVEDISEQLGLIVGEGLDSPGGEYEDMTKLVTKIANKIRTLRTELFVFEGVRKKDDNYFIVQFGVKGQGVEAPDQRRLEQFHVNLHYDQPRGLIRSWGCDISSPIGQHLWQSQPAEWNEIHFPSQQVDEIIQCHVGQMLTY
jgi:hypothetical protein